MNNILYQKPDHDLPYNIDVRYFKNISEGTVKEKYELRWVVLTEQVNEFVKTVKNTYEEKALTSIDRDVRGPLTVVTLNYGEAELNENYNGDGETEWWTFGGSVYSYHIRRWVTNTPQDIKAFCSHCLTGYGYEKDEVTVTCNPQAGAPRVMCEATFTPNLELDPEQDPTTNENWDNPEEDEELGENTESFNCSSTLDTLTPSAELYLAVKMGKDTETARTIIAIVNGVESGELVYKQVGDMGNEIQANGWYAPDDTNPDAVRAPIYYEGSISKKEDVDWARVVLKNIPDVVVPSIRVTTTTKVTSKNKLTMALMSAKMGTAGQMSASISGGGMTMPCPIFPYAWDAEGNKYPIYSVQWMNEGTSFDGTSIRKKSSLTTGKTFYEGTMSTSYRTITTLLSGGPSTISEANINLEV